VPAAGGKQAVPQDGATQGRRPIAGEVVPPVDLRTAHWFARGAQRSRLMREGDGTDGTRVSGTDHARVTGSTLGRRQRHRSVPSSCGGMAAGLGTRTVAQSRARVTSSRVHGSCRARRTSMAKRGSCAACSSASRCAPGSPRDAGGHIAPSAISSCSAQHWLLVLTACCMRCLKNNLECRGRSIQK